MAGEDKREYNEVKCCHVHMRMIRLPLFPGSVMLNEPFICHHTKFHHDDVTNKHNARASARFRLLSLHDDSLMHSNVIYTLFTI